MCMCVSSVCVCVWRGKEEEEEEEEEEGCNQIDARRHADLQALPLRLAEYSRALQLWPTLRTCEVEGRRILVTQTTKEIKVCFATSLYIFVCKTFD